MKKLRLLGIAVVLALGVNIQAANITGSIDMSGTAFLNNTLLGSAGAVSSFGGSTVGGLPTGAFTGTAGSTVTWSPFGWSPSTTPIVPLWTFTSGGTTYSFDLTSVTVAAQDNGFLNLQGSGTLYATDYEPTAGAWSFTISNPTGGEHPNWAFTFANSQTALVPDGGLTAMLLGGAVSVLALIRRKLA